MSPTPATDTEYVLTISCPDRPGIVYSVAAFLVQHHGNIRASQQFDDPLTGLFFLRMVFVCADPQATVTTLRDGFAVVAQSFQMTWILSSAAEPTRTLILVSRLGHCLNDLLFRASIGALHIQVVGVLSNHEDFRDLVQRHQLPYHCVPVGPANKSAAEAELLRLVAEERVDLVVLARYMQVLSDDACKQLEARAINIHHSMLPSFKGARPYERARERGVKVIGATAHYVTSDLDEGPIIEQATARIDHSMSAADVAALGRDTECLALARAVRWHVQRRVFLDGRRTVVFR